MHTLEWELVHCVIELLVSFLSFCEKFPSANLPSGEFPPLNKYSLNFSFRSHVIPQEKRNSFPRFYFLGDDDLLEILGQATKEEIIQKHIRKLFPGCQSLVIENVTSTSSSSVNRIKGIQSTDGDVVNLIKTVEMSGAIEVCIFFLVTFTVFV